MFYSVRIKLWDNSIWKFSLLSVPKKVSVLATCPLYTFFTVLEKKKTSHKIKTIWNLTTTITLLIFCFDLQSKATTLDLDLMVLTVKVVYWFDIVINKNADIELGLFPYTFLPLAVWKCPINIVTTVTTWFFLFSYFSLLANYVKWKWILGRLKINLLAVFQVMEQIILF